MTEPLAPQYNPSAIESALYRWWKERGLFSPDAARPGVGRALRDHDAAAQRDRRAAHGSRPQQHRAGRADPLRAHARPARRSGCPAPITPASPPRTWSSGCSPRRALTRFDLGREAFVERVWAHVRETGAAILEQLKAIGCSADWSRTYFTLDDGLSRAVREVFVRLYEKGLIYRGHYIINWCPRCLTALSNEEAEKEEVDGKLWHIRYPLADGSGHVTVATTRPETMLGDTPWRCTRRTSATAHLIGRERAPAAGGPPRSRSWPTRRWTRRSAPAR